MTAGIGDPVDPEDLLPLPLPSRRAIVRQGDSGVDIQIGLYTLSVHLGRHAPAPGTPGLPSTPPSISIYRDVYDDRKLMIVGYDLLKPLDPGFGAAVQNMIEAVE